MSTPSAPVPAVKGIHHTAYVTWDPVGTVRFHRDILGFRVAQMITAKGWGPKDHADFVHILLDCGNDNVIAFFYYFGTIKRDQSIHDYIDRGRHLAFRVDTEAELTAWHEHLRRHGVEVSDIVQHETVRSIYFCDPNGLQLEISCWQRPMTELDIHDGEMSLQAFLDVVEKEGSTLEDVWRRKGELVRRRFLDAAR